MVSCNMKAPRSWKLLPLFKIYIYCSFSDLFIHTEMESFRIFVQVLITADVYMVCEVILFQVAEPVRYFQPQVQPFPNTKTIKHVLLLTSMAE